MKKGQDTRGYERYMALDIHREYLLVGAWNEKKDWVLTPRRVSIEKFPEWAKKNIRPGDIVVLETTTNVWTIYDIVAPLASRVLVANAAEVGEIASQGQDRQGRYQTVIEAAHWRDRAGSVGTSSSSERTAGFYVVSWPAGKNSNNDSQSPAKSAAQAQPDVVRGRAAGSSLVGSTEKHQRTREDADPPGIGPAAGGGEARRPRWMKNSNIKAQVRLGANKLCRSCSCPVWDSLSR